MTVNIVTKRIKNKKGAEMKKRVVLGMSGGVDSSVAAILLREQGYDVIGVTLKLWETECVDDAKRVCEHLRIPHYTMDLKEQFNKHVVEYFIRTYADCKTPNPCIECNRFLKFDQMYKKAIELNADYMATGHYAKTEFSNEYNKYVLKKSKAGKKDQSYVLYCIQKEFLSKTIFPLGDFEDKEEIRKIAKENGLEVASKPDSEDICFIPDGDYKKFLTANSYIEKRKGDIVDIDGNILGKHNGLYNYTIGQRKGMGIAHANPLYVIRLDAQNNKLVVGEEKDLYKSEIEVEQVRFLLIDEITEPIKVRAKIRYSSKEATRNNLQN